MGGLLSGPTLDPCESLAPLKRGVFREIVEGPPGDFPAASPSPPPLLWGLPPLVLTSESRLSSPGASITSPPSGISGKKNASL